MKRAIWILWPSFIVAGIGEVLFFTVFDPQELGLSRPVAYTAGFFLFWAFAAASSAFTCFLQRTSEEINRKRADRNAAC